MVILRLTILNNTAIMSIPLIYKLIPHYLLAFDRMSASHIKIIKTIHCTPDPSLIEGELHINQIILRDGFNRNIRSGK